MSENQESAKGFTRRESLVLGGMLVGGMSIADAAGVLKLPAAHAAVNWYYPFTAPSGMSRGFGLDEGEQHNGIDFVPGDGTPVYSIAAGTVVVAGWRADFGWHVVIDHSPGTSYYSVYGHMQMGSLTSATTVAAGQQLGLVGTTGDSSGPHLHLAISTSGYYSGYVDPAAAPVYIHSRSFGTITGGNDMPAFTSNKAIVPIALTSGVWTMLRRNDPPTVASYDLAAAAGSGLMNTVAHFTFSGLYVGESITAKFGLYTSATSISDYYEQTFSGTDDGVVKGDYTANLSIPPGVSLIMRVLASTSGVVIDQWATRNFSW